MCIFNSKRSNTSTKEDSVGVAVKESQYPDKAKGLDTQQESPHQRIKAGQDLLLVLEVAQRESRVVIGVPAAVKYLSVAPEDSLFCLLAPPKQGDSAMHIQEVLLKAFCLENDIYIIEVDCAEKLGRLLNMKSLEVCVLIQKGRLLGSSEEVMSVNEDSLIDFCEEYWDAPRQPIVQLPDT